MNRPASLPVHIQPTPPADQVAALGLVFAHLPEADRERHIAQVLAEAEGQPLAGLWGAYRGNRLVAAMLSQIQAGRIAFVSPPRAIPTERPETARRLVARVLDDLAGRHVQWAQALLSTDHGPDVDRLVEAGFRPVANLLYLVSLSGIFPTEAPPDGLDFLAYGPTEHERLGKLVERTYVASLDCPHVEPARGIDDVLAGYRSTGVFDPSRWLIVRHQGSDVGCVLLTDHPHLGQWELIYMGVVPEARGRGVGVAIARQAQWLARQAGRERLTLAVDAANSPALDVYAAAGFVAWDQCSVFLRSF